MQVSTIESALAASKLYEIVYLFKQNIFFPYFLNEPKLLSPTKSYSLAKYLKKFSFLY